MTSCDDGGGHSCSCHAYTTEIRASNSPCSEARMVQRLTLQPRHLDTSFRLQKTRDTSII